MILHEYIMVVRFSYYEYFLTLTSSFVMINKCYILFLCVAVNEKYRALVNKVKNILMSMAGFGKTI